MSGSAVVAMHWRKLIVSVILLVLWIHLVRVLHLLLTALIWHIAIPVGLERGMRVRGLMELSLQRVYVVRIIHVVEDKLVVLLMDAPVLQEVGEISIIHAHIDHLLHEGLLSLGIEVLLALFLTRSERALARELLLYDAAASLGGWHR